MKTLEHSELIAFDPADTRVATDLLGDCLQSALTMVTGLQLGAGVDMFNTLQQRTGLEDSAMKEICELFIQREVSPYRPPANMVSWKILEAAASHVGLGAAEAVGLAQLLMGHVHTPEAGSLIREIMRRQKVMCLGLDRVIVNL